MFSTLRLPRIDDAARERGHGFVTLAAGQVHYRVQGPAEGPRVCLVHGTTSPLFTFDALSVALAEAGFCVLRFDLFGRGLSDRPKATYDLPFFAAQVRGVLDAVGWSSEVSLVGWSLGAIIAADVACSPGAGRHVPRVTLLAPAGFPIDMPKVAQLTLVPGVGEALMVLLGRRLLERSWRSVFAEPGAFEDYGVRFGEQLRYAGFIPALLSTLRNAPLQHAPRTWAKLARSKIATSILWGRRDAICPHANLKEALVALPEAEAATIEGAGHALHVERDEEVARLIVQHLRA